MVKKWFARGVLSLIPLAIIGLWLLGNYYLWLDHDHKVLKYSFGFWLGVISFVVDFLVGIALAIAIIFGTAQAVQWLWRTAEIHPRNHNRNRY